MNIGLIPYRNVKRYSHKEALVDANVGKRITWKEFNRRINHLAHAFLAYGLKKGIEWLSIRRIALNIWKFSSLVPRRASSFNR